MQWVSRSDTACQIGSPVVSRACVVGMGLLVGVLMFSETSRADVLPLTNVFTVNDRATGAERYADIIKTRGGLLVAYTGEVQPSGSEYILTRRIGRRGRQFGAPQILSRSDLQNTENFLVRLGRLSPSRWIASWENESAEDGDAFGIFSIPFDKDGLPLGNQAQVNLQFTDGYQRNADIATGNGHYLIVWTDDGEPTFNRVQVTAQRFDLDGNRIGAELVLAAEPEEYSYWPAATALRGNHEGDYLVAWESIVHGDTSSAYDVAARIVHRDGTIGPRIILNEDLSWADQGNPSVAATADGFIATWTTYDRDWNVYARRFDGEGHPLTHQFRVSSDAGFEHSASNIAVSRTGSYVILWTDTMEGGGTSQYARAYSSTDEPIGKEFWLSTKRAGFQGFSYLKSNLAFLNSTDFAAVWTETNGQLNPDIDGRVFRITTDRQLCGDLAGADLVVNTSDALAVLRASVGVGAPCSLCACDVDGSGDVSISDAQLVLRVASGIDAHTSCPACIY